MPVYRICNYALESDVPLPELAETGQEQGDSRFRLTRDRPSVPVPHEWERHWSLPGDVPWLRFARIGKKHFLRFPDRADFIVSADGRDIECCAPSETPEDTVRHLLLDQVIPLILSLRSGLVLHASAVRTPRGAVAFLGKSGAGKSTIAASLASQGLPLLTDDCILLEEQDGDLLVIPSYPGLRLWDDMIPPLFGGAPALDRVSHYNDKKRIGGKDGQLAFSDRPAPLARLYVLDPPDGQGAIRTLSIRPFSGRESFIELIRHAFFLDISDSRRLRRDFTAVGRAAERLLLRRLSYPRDVRQLPAVRDAILSDVGAGRDLAV